MSAAIYRGAEVRYNVDPVLSTAVVEGKIPTIAAPALSSYQPYIVPFTAASVSPSRYTIDKPFDLTFSGLSWATPGDLDGQATSTVIYSEPSTIGTSTIAGSAVTQTISANYTTEPHTVALMDSYGRILTVATLKGGAAAERQPENTPTATTVANTPSTPTAEKPAVRSSPRPASRRSESHSSRASCSSRVPVVSSSRAASGMPDPRTTEK